MFLSPWTCQTRSSCSPSAWATGMTTCSRQERRLAGSGHMVSGFTHMYQHVQHAVCAFSNPAADGSCGLCSSILHCGVTTLGRVSSGYAYGNVHKGLSRVYVWMLLHCVMLQQALTLDNPHTFPVDYEWALSSQVFSVTPSSGTIKPRSSQQVAVKWTPALSSSAKATSKQPSTQPKAAGVQQAATAAASAAAQAAPGSSPRKLSKTGSTGSSRRATAAPGAAPDSSPRLSRPSSKGPASGLASDAGPSANPTPRQKPDGRGGAAADRRESGAGSSIPANSSSITVELPADMSPAAPAAASAVGCQHTGYMTLQLRGGGDMPCKKVMLYGELPPSLLKFTAKEINLGPIPLCEQQTALVQIKNTGSTDAAYRVSALTNVLRCSGPGKLACIKLLWPLVTVASWAKAGFAHQLCMCVAYVVLHALNLSQQHCHHVASTTAVCWCCPPLLPVLSWVG